MTENASTPGPDALYAAVRSLPGWYYLLDRAEDSQGRGSGAWIAGTAISSVLLAAGEESVPLAVAGKLDDSYTGRLLVFYSTFVVDVTARDLRSDSGAVQTLIRPLAVASNLRVETRHSYFDGTDRHPRYRNFSFTFDLQDESMALMATNWTPNPAYLVTDEAVYAAYTAIRDLVCA